MLKSGEVVAGLIDELNGYHQLVVALTESDWRTPTRCTGWTVADLTAHVTGVVADITAGRLDGAGTQGWYDRQVDERRGLAPGAVVDELAGSIPAMRRLAEGYFLPNWDAPGPPGVPGTLGSTALALWAGFYIHGEDVRAALARPPGRGPGLPAAVQFIGDSWDVDNWGPVTLALDGMDEIRIGRGGRRVVGDPLTFVLAVSGRSDPTGLGLDRSVNIYA